MQTVTNIFNLLNMDKKSESEAQLTNTVAHLLLRQSVDESSFSPFQGKHT